MNAATVSFEYTFNGSQLEGAAVLLDKFAEQTMSIYVESGLFSEVRRGGGSADIMADVKIVRAEEGSVGMAVLTGLTLYLVPSKSTVTTTVKTSFRDVDGNTLGTFEKSEAVNVWQQFVNRYDCCDFATECEWRPQPILLVLRCRPAVGWRARVFPAGGRRCGQSFRPGPQQRLPDHPVRIPLGYLAMKSP
jgi:hypothetical protein